MKNIAKRAKTQSPYNNPLCDKSMNFEECELAILRNAVDINEKLQDDLIKEKQINVEELSAIFEILEGFLVRKKLILYGGFAINAVLPQYAKFYDFKHDIPDYDFYSANALDDAIELADLFFDKGYKEVEAKAGVHFGTYKVYVNFNGIADITQLEPSIFNNLRKDAIIINQIYYCPINFLRRNVYKELCQPLGDVSRWEKVFKRLNTLNESYPFTVPYSCDAVDFQRKLDTIDSNTGESIYNVLREAFVFMGAVFFGGYACSLYSQYMPPEHRKLVEKIPDFDVLYDDIDKGAQIVKEKLTAAGFDKIKLIKHPAIGEVITSHYEIRVGRDIVAFIYEPFGSNSYNIVSIKGQKLKIASIDTILFFYFSFYYSNQPYYYRDRILCVAKTLFDVEQTNRLDQRGILARFATGGCIGEQETLQMTRQKKTLKFKELTNKQSTREYMEWFLKYNPILGESRNLRRRHRRFHQAISLKNTRKPHKRTQRRQRDFRSAPGWIPSFFSRHRPNVSDKNNHIDRYWKLEKK